MITLESLHPRLRQLKLSGLQGALSARAEEARAGGLDPLEFLALLLDDELTRRESERVARRIHAARFEDRCDLRDFDFAYNPEIPKTRIWELAAGPFVTDHGAVLFCGPTGVGKSFVAQALGVQAMPPLPTQITSTPAWISRRMVRGSTMSRGSGEGVTRRCGARRWSWLAPSSRR